MSIQPQLVGQLMIINLENSAKIMFDSGRLSLEIPTKIKEFSKKFLVTQELVKFHLMHLKELEKKTLRKKKNETTG